MNSDFSIRHISERFRIDDLLRIRTESLNTNVYPLQGVLKNMSYGIVHDGDLATRPARELGHTIRVMQTALQYQLHTQRQLTDHIQELTKKNKLLSTTTREPINDNSNSSKEEIYALKHVINQLRNDLSEVQKKADSERSNHKELLEAVKGAATTNSAMHQQSQSSSADVVEKVVQAILMAQQKQQSPSPCQQTLHPSSVGQFYLDPSQQPVTQQSVSHMIETALSKQKKSRDRSRGRHHRTDQSVQSITEVLQGLLKQSKRDRRSRRRRRRHSPDSSSTEDSTRTEGTNIKDVLSQLLATSRSDSKKGHKSSRDRSSRKSKKEAPPKLIPYESMVISPLLQPTDSVSFSTATPVPDRVQEQQEAERVRELQLQKQLIEEQREQLRIEKENQSRIQQQLEHQSRERELEAQRKLEEVAARENEMRQRQEDLSNQRLLQAEQQAQLDARKLEMDCELQKKKQQLEQEARDRQIEESLRRQEEERVRQTQLRTQQEENLYRPTLLKPTLSEVENVNPAPEQRPSQQQQPESEEPSSPIDIIRVATELKGSPPVPLQPIYPVPVPAPVSEATAQKPIPCGSCGIDVLPSNITDHRVNHCVSRPILCAKCGEQVSFSDLEAHRQTCIHRGGSDSASTCSTTIDSDDGGPELVPSRSHESVTWKLSEQQPSAAASSSLHEVNTGIGDGLGDTPLRSELSVKSLRSKIAELELEATEGR
eukprot:TRINITY_DN1601_c6_g1_i2.p1 TRINITY_DN1601_c6_g1~~TRINITY_DN1601_c6_g1_i2.p1  ORF type:complete len:713 (+),score=178.82 TRINITY_DN1601_c6_g1_i2:91-2229(+)